MMYSLPTTVRVKDEELQITDNGDFRMVLDCFGALADEELGEDFRVLAALLIFYEKFDTMEDLMEYEEEDITTLVKEMYNFFNCGKVNGGGAKTDVPLVDWDKDSQIICAAVNNVAKKEIRELEYLHWWTFMGYYLSVGESVLSTVLSIRNKIVKHKKLDDWEKEFKRDNPDYFVWKNTTAEERDLTNQFREMWNTGGE